MSFKNYIEPFKELFFARGNAQYRLMRFFGRIPQCRSRRFSKEHTDHLKNVSLDNIISPLSPTDIILNLRDNGFSSSLKLSKSLLQCLLDVAIESSFVDRKTGLGSYRLTPSDLQKPDDGYIYSVFDPHLSNDKLLQFALEDVKPIADAYLGADAIIANSQIWATFPDNEEEFYNPDFGFHYDLDDYRFLKLFIYLTDVDLNSGPHYIIRQSHKMNAWFRFFNRRLSEKSAERYQKNIEVMLGKKGEGFFEDTLCYHKGSRPTKPRLIFQLEFALNKYN